MKDGTVKMNPGYNNPDIVETVGPTDSDIAAFSLRQSMVNR